MKLGTSICVNYSIWNPKHSAKYVYHTGTSASSIARAGIDLTSSKDCQPCDSSKTTRIQLISKDGKAILHLGGTGKNLGGILLLSITTTTDPALIDQGNLLKSDWDTYSRYDSQN